MKNQKNHSIPSILGVLLLSRELIFYIAFYILISSIEWPSSLGFEPQKVFRLISENTTTVFLGYYMYLISSVLYIPIVYTIRKLLLKNIRTVLLLDIAIGFAIASVVMRSLGILRWLYAIPNLSEIYLDPNSSDVLREMTILSYTSFNHYAGMAGEHLGVQLFGAFFIAAVGFSLVTVDNIPKLFGYWALFAALLFLPIGGLLGIDSSVWLTINGITFSLWAITFGIFLLKKGSYQKLATRIIE